MSIRSMLIVATAIATLGLGSPAFAATYGGYSNDTGNLMPSYYDQNGWHMGVPPEARAALAAPQRPTAAPTAPQRQSARPGRGLYLYAGPLSGIAQPVRGANDSEPSGAGGMSKEMMQNDWFWSRAR
jgi:hypothetical protein